MVEKPEKLPTLMQMPHTGMGPGEILEQWHDLVRNVYAQALIRSLTREEVESYIPLEVAAFIRVEQHSDALLVRAIQKPEAVIALNTICDSDCARLAADHQAQLELEARDKIGSADS